jgi:hypothetical protein
VNPTGNLNDVARWFLRTIRPITRLRLLRLRSNRLKRRLHAKGLSLTYLAADRIGFASEKAFEKVKANCATLLAAFIAAIIILTKTDVPFQSKGTDLGNFYLACAGIMGTALALVMSLSIVPAEKAANDFSASILRLYASDRALLAVFVKLALLTLVSVLFGTGLFLRLDNVWAISLQILLLGVALDAVRQFYVRALDLLIPQSALNLVYKECVRLMNMMSRRAHRIATIHRTREGEYAANPTGAQWLSFRTASRWEQQLLNWISQLEEVAHKALARLDTLAAESTVMIMARVAMKYADIRRESIMLVPDLSGIIPIGVSDVSRVLNPILDGIKNLCQDAVRHRSETIVAACIDALGLIASHAVTIVHTQDRGWSTAPLSHAPIYYLMRCSGEAERALMDDALLRAVRAIGSFFASTSEHVDTQEAEATALNCLFDIAHQSNARLSGVPSDQATKLLLAIAKRELQVRGPYRDNNLNTILDYIAALVPSEVVMEKSSQRLMHVFSPYGQTGLADLLLEEAQRVEHDESRSNDPFDSFNKLSRKIVLHFRRVAETVDFEGTLLEQWAINSALDCADVHMELLSNPPKGSATYTDTIEERLIWFIHTPASFFREKTSFPQRLADSTAGRLAAFGIRLLQLNSINVVMDCAKAITAIGMKSAAVENAHAYAVADIFASLETLARAAEALNYPALARRIRELEDRRKLVLLAPDYERAIANRVRNLDRRLADCPRAGDLHLRDDPVPLVQNILHQAKMLAHYRRRILNLIQNKASLAAKPQIHGLELSGQAGGN